MVAGPHRGLGTPTHVNSTLFVVTLARARDERGIGGCCRHVGTLWMARDVELGSPVLFQNRGYPTQQLKSVSGLRLRLQVFLADVPPCLPLSALPGPGEASL